MTTDTPKRMIRYGDKEFEFDAGMTIEQAKSIMARHFPELADPEVITKKEGDATVYTFTKKAGRKGALTEITALLAIKPAQVLPDDILQIAAILLHDDPGTADAYPSKGVSQLRQDIATVNRIATGLADILPVQTSAGGMLL